MECPSACAIWRDIVWILKYFETLKKKSEIVGNIVSEATEYFNVNLCGWIVVQDDEFIADVFGNITLL